MSSLTMKVLYRLITRLPPPRKIRDREGGSLYLSRYYLKKRHAHGRFGIYLHRFHRSDDDRALHNHPWSWACSLVLWGGYHEERRTKAGDVVVRRVGPGSLNIIHHNTFHRVDLIKDECWSLFFAGRDVKDWGFWCRDTKAYADWRSFIEQKRGAEIPEEELK